MKKNGPAVGVSMLPPILGTMRNSVLALCFAASLIATPVHAGCKPSQILIADVDDFKATAERIRDQLQPDFPAVVKIMRRGSDPIAFADKLATFSPRIVIVHFSMFRAMPVEHNNDDLLILNNAEREDLFAQDEQLDLKRTSSFLAFIARLDADIKGTAHYLIFSASFRGLTKADLRNHGLPASITDDRIDMIFSSVENRMEPGNKEGGIIDLRAKVDAAFSQVCT